MKFWDREKEKEWLKHYLQTEPNAILFVYGPKSSGKTTLLMKVVEELPKNDFVYYWFDLREKFITGYESAMEVFFKEKGWLKSFIEAVSPKINLGVFEIEPDGLEKLLKGKLDPFEEMRKRLEGEKRRGRIPVIVFDELQKLKEIYLNGDSRQRPLVRELFNFFVRITKVLHLAHVIVMTSDTFFIEQVYTDSTLKNTSRFYLVDFFDDETAERILISEGLSEQDARYVVNWIGGVPWMLEEILEAKENFKDTIQELFDESRSRLELFLMQKENPKGYEDVLKGILSGNFKLSRENIKAVKDMVEAEILFYDPVKGKIRFQTKLDERAAREILGVE